MSLFESLKKAILYNPLAPSQDASSAHAARPAAPASNVRPAQQASPPAQGAPAGAAPSPAGATGSTGQVASSQSAGPATASPSPAPGAVDVEAVLDGLNARSPQKLNWRTSIVDLMKLVQLDPSLQHRKELAQELGYTGDMNDSAAMNIWLHKAVMRKLAENGGKVPSTLQ